MCFFFFVFIFGTCRAALQPLPFVYWHSSTQYFFPFLTSLAAHRSAVYVIQPHLPPPPPPSAMISSPLLTSPLTSIHSCLAGCWSGPAASVAWFIVRPSTFAPLCACLCLCWSHVEPYFARPSQQSNNEAKRWHSLKQVFRLMAQSIRSKSLSNTSWCLFFLNMFGPIALA